MSLHVLPHAPGHRREATDQLARRLASTTDELEARALRDELVIVNLEVARSLTHRFRNRGIGDDDLEQVACLGLLGAARRFDPARGHDFLSFAVPTIRGEIRRHFRDQGWMVRPTRTIQELQAKIVVVEAVLYQRLGRTPSTHEVAEEVGHGEPVVREAMAAQGCFLPTSLDLPVPDRDGSSTLAERLGSLDPALAAADARAVLEPVLGRLSTRDRRALHLRFCEDLNQREIGARIGVTQMQVSRLLTRILRELRDALAEDDPPSTSTAAKQHARTG